MASNILIGGAAGQGIDTTTAILERLLKQAGFFVFSTRDLMSRIRGGHNFTLIRFGAAPIYGHSQKLDGLVALNEETLVMHRGQLAEEGFIMCDKAVACDDPRTILIDMQQIAKSLGNPKVTGSVAVGALLGLFSLKPGQIEATLKSLINPSYIDVNRQAIEAGLRSVQPRFTAQPGQYHDWMTITGNQALALGALSSGLRFYSAYPMSPSTSIMEYLAANSLSCGVVVEQAEDEIAAVNMAIGASCAGVRSMTCTSGGGFCLMTEALGLAGMTEIPLVIGDVQRPGPATGLPTRTEQADLKFVISAAQGEFPRLVTALRHHQDAFEQTGRAFRLAERYQIPVILLSDQYLADASSTVQPFAIPETVPSLADLPVDAALYQRYQITGDGVSPRLLPGHPQHLVTVDSDEHDERGLITESAEIRKQMMDKRLRKIAGIRQELQEPEFLGSGSCHTLLLGWGSLYGPLREAVDLLNNAEPGQYGALVFGDVFPLPTGKIMALADSGKSGRRLVNVEQNATGQLAGLIREYTGITCQASLLKYDGRQWSGEEIASQVRPSQAGEAKQP